MKLANFTFSRVGTWLLKSALPMLVFMTLSLGVEAQVQSPADVLADREGVDLVDEQVAVQRLKDHIGQLEAQSPVTDEDRANVQFRSDYAYYIFYSVGKDGGYQYTLLNSMPFLDDRAEAVEAQSGIIIDTQEIYQEMLDLMGS